MHDTSGLTLPEPLAFFDRESWSWRMSAATFPWEPERSLETLPASGMTLGGRLYELPTLVPATAVHGCSSLPTPTVGDSKSPRNSTAGRTNPDSGHHSGTTLTDAVTLLPTPTTQPGTGNGHARNLGKEVKMLPTPMSRDHKGRPLPREGGDDLNMAVGRLLPTPQGRDGDHARGADPERYRGSKSMGGRRVNLDDMIAATRAGRFSGAPTVPPSSDTPPCSDDPHPTLWTDEDD